MKSIVVTYPEFQSLPKGLKRMLVASETYFFSEAKPALTTQRPWETSGAREDVISRSWRLWTPSWQESTYPGTLPNGWLRATG